MQVKKPRPVRTHIDLSDERQVRLVRKRFGLSESELVRIVEKIGNSLSAISKEAQLGKASTGDH